MKIKITTLSTLLLLIVFSTIHGYAQQLQLVRVIDTVLSVKTTNTTGNNIYIDVTKKPMISKTIVVPKGKVWIVNTAQPSHLGKIADFYNSNTGGSRGSAYGKLRLDDGGDVFHATSTIGGKLTLSAGTEISAEVYTVIDNLVNGYKWIRHVGSYPSTHTWYQYFFSITEYEIVP